ncbi:hypothetical protein [Candidatus Uabimicrobium sp. HlEnr_7]|uniref:hypothetical protein n=1 Tax=Candidatus Uabimicrobium helgolandensis TaxID=3095367 RepID=UPI003558E3A0
MKCLKCKQDTPDTEMYCTHCGFKMDVTYDEITKKLDKDTKKEKEEETAAFSRWVLMIGLVVFISAIIFRSLWTNPPYPNPIPNYVPLKEVPHEPTNTTKPHYLKKEDIK